MLFEQERRFQILLAASEISDPTDGPFAYQTWYDYNQRYFDDQLLPVPIVFGLVPHGRALSHYDGYRRRELLHPSLFVPQGENPWHVLPILGRLLAAEVILHDMIHMRVWQLCGSRGKGASSHNNPFFIREINRLAPLLGLPANASLIKQQRTGDRVQWVHLPEFLSRGELAVWPYGMRPADYFDAESFPLLDQLIHGHSKTKKKEDGV